MSDFQKMKKEMGAKVEIYPGLISSPGFLLLRQQHGRYNSIIYFNYTVDDLSYFWHWGPNKTGGWKSIVEACGRHD